MKINHVALFTNKLEELRDFYEKYFQGKPNEKYHNKNTGLETYFLSFQGGARLEIMKRPDIEEKDDTFERLGFIHLAFSVGCKENVDNLTALLEKDGFPVISKPRTTGDGYYESCILDPDGNKIEIVE